MKKCYTTPDVSLTQYEERLDALMTSASGVGTENWYNDGSQYGEDNFA